MSDYDLSAIEDHFHAAIELEGAERQRYLDALEQRDAGLANEVRSLLQHAHGTEVESTVESMASMASRLGIGPLRPGMWVGDFEILQPLGEGGSGRVFLARQRTPVRNVALKVMRAGLNEERGQILFELEAAVLASVSCPGIAHVYASGTLESSGQRLPWFALELVEEARSILRYAREERPSMRERVQLLTEVARAIAHAHRRGIVHRDLKPSNVLVDEAQSVKVIDFGIASSSSLGAATGSSGSAVAGTPGYMSPEQMEGSTIDARTDVFALGVLFEQVATVTSGDGRLTLPRDLDLILCKARATDPENRYPDAAELLADLVGWLQRRPVSVRKPSIPYTLSCLAKRNPWFTSAAAVAVLTFVGGFASTAWGLARARQSSENARWGVDFFRTWLEEADPLGEAGPTIPFDQAVARAAERLDESQPPVALEADLRHSFGVALLDAGHPQAAESHLRRALELRRDEFGLEASATFDTEVELGFVLLAMDQKDEALQLGQHAEQGRRALAGGDDAETLNAAILVGRALVEGRLADDPIGAMQELLQRCKEAQGEDHPQTMTVRNNLGTAFTLMERWNEANAEYRLVLEWRLKELGEDSVLTQNARKNLGTGLARTGQLEEAREQIELAQAGLMKALGPEHPMALRVRSDLAVTLRMLGRVEEASEILDSVVRARQRILGASHSVTLGTKLNLLTALMFAARYGDQELASARWRRVDRLFQELQESRSHCTPEQQNQLDSKLAEVHAFHRRWAAAVAAFDRARTNSLHERGGYRDLYLEGRFLHARWMADSIGLPPTEPPAELLDCVERLKAIVGPKSAFVTTIEDLLPLD